MFFMECLKIFNVSTIGHTAHIKFIVQFLPNAFQLWIVDDCNSFHFSGLQFIHVFWKARLIVQFLCKPPQKEIKGCEIWRPGHENVTISPRSSNPSLRLCFQKLSNPEAPVGGASFCTKIKSSDSSSFNLSISHYFSMSRCVTPLTVTPSKKNGHEFTMSSQCGLSF